MPAPRPGDQRDALEVDLHYPMLTGYLRSQALRAELLGVAREILARWEARVPRNTGNLAATGRAVSRKGISQRSADAGWRWEAEFEAGGPQAPYAPEVEAEHHTLEDVLRSMGYGDVVIF